MTASLDESSRQIEVWGEPFPQLGEGNIQYSCNDNQRDVLYIVTTRVVYAFTVHTSTDIMYLSVEIPPQNLPQQHPHPLTPTHTHTSPTHTQTHTQTHITHSHITHPRPNTHHPLTPITHKTPHIHTHTPTHSEWALTLS